jgi:hypothetical protein
MQLRSRTRAILAAAVMGVGLASTARATITVNTTTNADTMVGSLIDVSSGITVTPGTATFTGGTNSSGTFSNANFLGTDFTSGVVLTTGNASNLDGPNGQSSDFSVNNGFAGGNTKLNAIVTPRTTNNASTLSFDFVPTNDTISFQFVFGSEEYNEFVGSSFNDVFGFFLNGENIALIPGTNTAIAINNVNGGNGPNNPPQNQQFFTDNTGGGLDTKLDGLVGQTMSLFAIGSVTPGETNTIEIAIGDTTDTSFDSAVFLKGASFTDEPPPPPPPPPPPGVIPLPAGVWAGMTLLGGMGMFSKFRKRIF